MAEKHYKSRLDFRTRIRVRLTYEKGAVQSFLVKLEHDPTELLENEWIEIARFDHNPGGGGHDVIEEGLHADLNPANHEEYTYWFPEDCAVPSKLSEIVVYCENLLSNHYDTFLQVYLGELRPNEFEPESLLESERGFNRDDE